MHQVRKLICRSLLFGSRTTNNSFLRYSIENKQPTTQKEAPKKIPINMFKEINSIQNTIIFAAILIGGIFYWKQQANDVNEKSTK